jgi:PilZ domain
MIRMPPPPDGLPTEDLNAEHRRSPRVNLFQEVLCEGGGTTARSQRADISRGGMFIDLSPPPFRAGDPVTLWITLNPGEPQITAQATVHYVQAGIGMGVRFQGLRLEDAERIETFVEQARRKRAPTGQPPLRRSSRVAVEVPVLVRATPPSGGDFAERTSIITLSKHGACLLTRYAVDIGMKLLLETPSGREFKGSIVWIGTESSRSLGQVGIQCRGLAQALGFQFP